MEKTIEERIADGVAKGIQQAKNAEADMKSKNAKEKASGLVAFLLICMFTCFILVAIQTTGIKHFGMNKHFLHAFAYPLAIVSQLGFTILFYKEDFKTHFFGTLIMTFTNTFVIGYFISLGF